MSRCNLVTICTPWFPSDHQSDPSQDSCWFLYFVIFQSLKDTWLFSAADMFQGILEEWSPLEMNSLSGTDGVQLQGFTHPSGNSVFLLTPLLPWCSHYGHCRCISVRAVIFSPLLSGVCSRRPAHPAHIVESFAASLRMRLNSQEPSGAVGA